MRINCHAHVFNAKSVFNEYTLEILINRISEAEIPDIIKKAVTQNLKKVIKEAGEYVDEKEFFQRILAELAETEEYKALLKKVKPSLKLEIEIVGSDKIQDASVDVFTRLIGKIGDTIGEGDKDARKKGVADFLDFLRIGFQPSIRHVTDIIVRQLPGNSNGLIALMMDITEDGDDKGQFERQLRNTSDMVLAYPGRLFPFVAVNTKRPDHFQIMERALAGMGYVGVKLYPSLGYDIDSPAMFDVYAYCEARQVPLLMHCSKGGFKHSDTFTHHSSPKLWKKILKKHKNLKICFGHFGGDAYLAGLPETDETAPWGPMVLELMESYPNVYADLGYHTAPMSSVDAEKIYFKNLKKYLKNETYRNRILWGTDYFLVRQRLREKNHWPYFQKRLGKDLFDQISVTNPAAYLGLDTEAATWTIKNYVQFIARHAADVETKPVSWLTKAVRKTLGSDVTFQATPLGRAWSRNNKAHVVLYEEFNETEFLETTAFEEAGSIKLSAMVYWRDLRLGSAQLARVKLRRRAVKLIDVFKRNNAVPVKKNGKSLTKDQITKELTPTLKNGSKTIADLAAACDSLFEFKVV